MIHSDSIEPLAARLVRFLNEPMAPLEALKDWPIFEAAGRPVVLWNAEELRTDIRLVCALKDEKKRLQAAVEFSVKWTIEGEIRGLPAFESVRSNCGQMRLMKPEFASVNDAVTIILASLAMEDSPVAITKCAWKECEDFFLQRIKRKGHPREYCPGKTCKSRAGHQREWS